MNINTVNKLIEVWKDIATRHYQINSFGIGNDWEIGVSTAEMHPTLWIEPVTATMPSGDHGYQTFEIDFEVRVFDLVNKNESNENDVLSDTIDILKDIIIQFKEHPFYVESQIDIINDISFESFTEEFDDEVSGWLCEISLMTPVLTTYCGIASEPIDTPAPPPVVNNAFEFTIDTTNTGSSSDTFILPLGNDGTFAPYNAIIDWGDATTSTITTYNDADLTHVYSTGGVYNISITGVLPWVEFRFTGDKLKMLDITNWGDVGFESCNRSFKGCTNLIVSATDSGNFGSVKVFNTMFYGCVSFNGAINNWDVSSAESLQETFYDCASFNNTLSSWNVSSVDNMYGMFRGCTIFNQDISSWVTTSLTRLGYIFNNCTNFNQDVSLWDVSLVHEMTGMFQNTALDNTNYQSILTGWTGWTGGAPTKTVQPSVNAHFGTAKYGIGTDSEDAKNWLTGVGNTWTITDGGGI